MKMVVKVGFLILMFVSVLSFGMQLDSSKQLECRKRCCLLGAFAGLAPFVGFGVGGTVGMLVGAVGSFNWARAAFEVGSSYCKNKKRNLDDHYSDEAYNFDRKIFIRSFTRGVAYSIGLAGSVYTIKTYFFGKK